MTTNGDRDDDWVYEDLDEDGEAANEEASDVLDALAADDASRVTADTDAGGDDVADALAAGPPLFLLHRGTQHAEVVPRVLADLARSVVPDIRLGVVASVPRTKPQALQQFFSACGSAPVRIADPEGFARADSFGPTLETQKGSGPYVGVTLQAQWPYFTRQLPTGVTKAWVGEVLDVQRVAGATLLLTPGMWADPASPQQAMTAMRQHADWARQQLQPDEHLAVNVTLPAAWLSNQRLLSLLLDEVVDMSELVFYMRVRWPLMPQPYGQLIDASVLDGYIEVANTFEDSDKTLILPNTSLTGWVALAWGAHGFSTGVGGGERAFADTRAIRIKRTGPRPAPITRTFATPILHTTDTTTAARLDALPNARACTCRYCVALRRLPAGQHDKALAGGHFLRAAGDLTAAVARNRRGRRSAARSAVASARRTVLRAANSVPLTDANEPRHLSLWADRLR